jgi:hypothetical protein
MALGFAIFARRVVASRLVLHFTSIAKTAASAKATSAVRDQFARDLSEARTARRAREREEFTEIRTTLDAGRLLAAHSHSHGLRRAWDAQTDHEGVRRKAVKSAFYSACSALVDRMDLSGEQLSAARVARRHAHAHRVRAVGTGEHPAGPACGARCRGAGTSGGTA